jgi:hypothetical protein
MSRRPLRRRRLAIEVAFVAGLLFAGSVLPSTALRARDDGGAAPQRVGSSVGSTTTTVPACKVSIVAAGDFSTPLPDIDKTGLQATILAPTYAMLLGDLQYVDGSLASYLNVYATTAWAKLNPIARPTPGNHDYKTPGAAGYYSYFGVAPFYAYNIGCGWRAYSLNSEIDLTRQIAFVAADIAAHPNKRLVAYWHKPVWSSGRHGDNARFAKLIAAFGGRLEVALWGHDHDYERGAAGPLTWFVVGTGGSAEGPMPTTRTTGSQVAIDQVSGVLNMTFTRDGWTARFIDTTGKVRDSAAG